jgi:hypothetical protein
LFGLSSTVFGTLYSWPGVKHFWRNWKPEKYPGHQKKKKVAHYFRHAAVVLASAPLRLAHKINLFLLSQYVFVLTAAGQAYDNGKK